MSTVDKRVVQMVFDNEEFEKNIAKSQKSLESIDKQLSTMSEGVKEDKIANAVTKGMNEAESIISAKAEIFRGIMIKIGGEIGEFFTSTIKQAKNAIDSLTFDQINVGFSKYEQKLTSVQTIMNATGKSIEYVEEQLEKLNWFTDETSYNYADMASNIGKFTAVGIELETASSAMQGIANWAALAGQNSQSASRAMYNLAQSLSKGFVAQQDWASIQNANMDNAAFRKATLESARKLAKEGKYTHLSYEALMEMTENDFFSELGKSKNLTTEVLLDTLQRFSAYSDAVKKYSDEYDWTTVRAMDNLNALREVTDKYGADSEEAFKKAKELGFKVSEQYGDVAAQIADIATAYDELGKDAFEAAQMYKTFADVIGATTDAASTLWMNIFQEIFGNFEEAKEFWTELGGIFYEVFVTPVEKIQEMFKVWNHFSGRSILLGVGDEANSVFSNLYDNLTKIKTMVDAAFTSVFPFLTDMESLGKQMAVATYYIREFVASLAPNTEQLSKIYDASLGLFKILRGIGKIIYSIIRSLGVIAKAILPTFDEILEMFGIVNDHADTVEGALESVAQTIWRVSNVIAVIIKGLKQSIMDGSIKEYLISLGKFLLYFAVTTLMQFVQKVKDAFNGVSSEFGSFSDVVANVVGTIAKYIYSIATAIIEGIGKAIDDFVNSNATQSFLDFFRQIPISVSGIFQHLCNIFKNLLVIVERILATISEFVAKLGSNTSATQLGATIAAVIGLILIIIQAFAESVRDGKTDKMTQAYVDLFDSIGKALNSFQHMADATALKQIALSLTLIAVAALMLASIPSKDLMQTMIILTGSLVALVGALAVVSSLSASKVGASGVAGILSAVQKLAIGILIMSNIVLKFMKKDPDELKMAIFALGGIVMDIAILVGILRVFTAKFTGENDEIYKKEIDSVIKILDKMLVLSIAISILASNFKKLGKLNSEQLANGLLGMTAVVGMISWILHDIRKFMKGDYAKMDLMFENLNKITIALLAVSASIASLVAGVIIFAVLPQAIIIKGFLVMRMIIQWVRNMFTQIFKITKNISKESINVNTTGLLLLAIAAGVAVMCAAINFLIVPIYAFGLLPLPLLIQGVLAFGVVVTIVEVFLAIIKRIIIGKNSKETGLVVQNDGPKKVMRWGLGLLSLSVSLLFMSMGLAALSVPIVAMATMAKHGKLWDAVAGFAVIMGIILAFFALLRVVMGRFSVEDKHGDKYIGASLEEYSGFLVRMSTALLIMSIGLIAIAKSIDYIGSIDPNVYKDGAIRIMKVLGWIIIAFMIIRVATIPFKKFAQDKEVAGISAIAKDIFMMGSGLFLMASSLMALLLPIMIMSALKPGTFERGFFRCAEVLGLVMAFLGILMVMFGVSERITGGKGIGDRKTVNTVEKSKSIFKRNKNVTTKTMDGFGETLFKVGKALMLIAAAITLLLVPIAILGVMGADNKDVWRNGMAGISIIMGLITAVILSMSLLMHVGSVSQMWAAVAMLAVITLCVIALTETCKALSDWMLELDKNSISKFGYTSGLNKFLNGIFGFVAILVTLLGSAWLLSLIKEEELIKKAGAVAIIAASILAVALALKIMGDAYDKNGDAMWSGAILLGLAVAVIGVIVAILAEHGDKALQGAGGFAIAVTSIGVSLLLIGAAMLVLQKALDALIKTAENSKEGWDAIYAGVGVFLSFAIVVGVIIGLFALFVSKVPIIAFAVLGLCAAVFLLAAAFLATVLGLILLSENWDEIELLLDKVDTWLELHSAEWANILGRFLAQTVIAFADTLKEMGGTIGTWFSDVQTGIEEGKGLAKSLWDANVKMGENLYKKDSPVFGAIANLAKTPVAYSGPLAGLTYGDIGSGGLLFGLAGMADSPDQLKYNEFVNEVNTAKQLMKTANDYSDWSSEAIDLLNEHKLTKDDIDALRFLIALRYADPDKFMSESELSRYVNQAGYGSNRNFTLGYLWSLAGGRYAGETSTYTSNSTALLDKKNKLLLNARSDPTYGGANEAYMEHLYGRYQATDNLNNTVENLDNTVSTFSGNIEQLNDDGNVLMFYSGGVVEDVSSGAGMAGDGDVIYAAANGYGSQLATEKALQKSVEEGTKQGILDGLWTWFANAGDGVSNFMYSLFGKEKVDEWSTGVGNWVDENLGKAGAGFEKLTGVSVDDLKAIGLGLVGVDVNSKEGQELMNALSSENAGNTVKKLTKSLAEDAKNGKLTKEQITQRFEEAGLGALKIGESDWVNQIMEASGLDLFAKGDYTDILNGIEMPDVSKEIEDQVNNAISGLTGNLIDENGNVNIDPNSWNFDYSSVNPDDILAQYGWTADDFYNLGNENGMSQAYGQLDGYKDVINKQTDSILKDTDFSSKYSSLTGRSKASDMVTRVINGQYIDAPKVLDLVKPIFQEGIFNKKTMTSIVDKGKKWGEKLSLFSSVTPKTQDFWDKVDEEGKLFAMANPDTANFWDDVYIEGNKIMTDKFKTNPLAVAAFMTSKMSEKKVEKSIEDGVKTTTTAVKKEQGSKFVSKNSSAAKSSSTSAVTTIDKEQAKNKAAQNGYYVDPNGNVYGAKTQAQTGTSAQSAAQSAATSLDYLRSINGYSFYMYQMMQNMQMQMASIDQNTGIIRDNVTEIKTQPKPAVLGEDQVRKVANFTNLALGKAASLTRRGVTS